MGTPVRSAESALLEEITSQADRIRSLRRTGAVANRAEIERLSVAQRRNWDELRALRAPAVQEEASTRRFGRYL